MIQIKAAVIHELKKEKHVNGPDSVDIVKREHLHKHNNLLEQFVTKIDSDSRTATKASSKCSIFTKENTFGKIVSDYFVENDRHTLHLDDFLALTIKLLEALRVRMSKVLTATGGHIPILWYQRDSKEYLLIGLVNPSSGFTIDADGNIVNNTNVDKEALRFSLRVELEPLTSHHELLMSQTPEPDEDALDQITPYARWTRKNEDIAHYFQDFLPIDQLLNDGEETRRYISLFDEYLDYVIPNTAPKEHKKVRFEIKQQIYNKMNQKRIAREVVRVEEDIVPILNAMADSYPSVFESYDKITPYHEFCEENGYEDYNSIFNPKKSDLDKVLNVSIAIGDDLTLRGSKDGITRASQIVVYKHDSEQNTYKLLTELSEKQYNALKSSIPEIDVISNDPDSD